MAMQPYPHIYRSGAAGGAGGEVTVSAPGLPSFQTTAPPAFGGPAGYWSPETLLCAALADCFVLTFRAFARAAGLEWRHLECQVEGVLERNARQVSFTRFTTEATLALPAAADPTQARALLERAERDCLVARSLAAEHTLVAHVTEGPAA